MVTNPNYYSQSTTSTFNQIEDGVDFPHTGIIKSLSDGLGQNYAISGFDITIDSATQIDVGAGVIFRDGKKEDISAVNNLALGRTTANENSYHLVVVNSSDAIVIRSPSAKDKVPDYTAGDTIIAVVTHNGSNPMPIQYLTVNKTENSLSVGRDSSGYTEGLTIQTTNAGATIEAKESNKDIIFKTNAGGSSTEAMRIDGATGNVGIGASTPSSALHVQKDTTGDLVILESFTQDANVAPDIILLRSAGSGASGQGADGDGLGLISFQGRDAISAYGQNSVYAEIFGNIENATDGAHNGQLRLRIAKGGVLPTAINILSGEIVINEDSYDIDFRVESNGNANMLVVDADNDRIGIGTNTPTTMLHIKSSGTGEPKITVENTNDDSQEPQLEFKKNGTSPANSDDLGIIRFVGDDSNGSAHLYAYIMADSEDVTAGAEEGRIFFYVSKAGINIAVLNLNHDEVVVNDGSSDVNFRVESDNNQNMLFVDAGNDKIGIGNSSPDATLDVEDGGTFRSTRLLNVSISTATTLTEADHAGRYLLCSANVTLPSTSSAGEHYTILNTTGGNITVGRNGNNINGAGSDATVATFNGVTCIAIGSNNWIALGV